VFAASIRGRPIVLALAGVEHLAEPGARSPGRIAPGGLGGGDPTPLCAATTTHAGDASDIDHAAAGYGLLNATPGRRCARDPAARAWSAT
jgi:hypothetical protein